MEQPRRAAFGVTLDGKPRTRRKAAVGEELKRVVALIFGAIKAAGKDGIQRIELVRTVDAGDDQVTTAIEKLHKARRIYVSTWRRGLPVFAAGRREDLPKPAPVIASRPPAPPKLDAAEMAAADIAAAHAAWAANWEPRCDAAAAWITRAAA